MATVVLFAALAANADPIPNPESIYLETKQTTGCFNADCTPAPTAQDQGLTFVGTSFAGVVQNGSDILLGQFKLISDYAWFWDDQFSALISFSLPTGAGNQIVTARLKGNVYQHQGEAAVSWTEHVIPINFDGGSFNLYLEDVGINNDGTANWNAEVRDLTLVPEPATMLLLGSGLLAGGIGRRFRLRRKS